MEDGLVLTIERFEDSDTFVLILVVMEDGLVLSEILLIKSVKRCLNPCCNGRWSRTQHDDWSSRADSVLILVVMEDGLVLVFIRLY